VFIPLKTDRPTIRRPYLTIALIVVCTIVQIWSRLAGTIPLPLGGQEIEMEWMVAMGGLWGDNPGDLIKWFTHQFVHGDELHLIGNMLFLWIFGSLVEDVLRPWGLAALYLAGGVLAAVCELTVSSMAGKDVGIPMVGASGAVAAIMGLFMLRFHKTQVEVFYWVFYVRGTFWAASWWLLAAWVGFEIFDGVLSMQAEGGGVAHWAHVGGFLAGVVAAPFVGGISGAKKEYFSDDPEVNVEYLRRSEDVLKAEKALRADPGNAYQLRRLAQAHQHAGDYEEATRAFERSVYRFAGRGLMEQACDVYTEMIAHNDAATVPPDLLVKIAQHLESNNLTLAVWTYQQLVSRHPTRPEGEHSLLRLATLYQHTLQRPHDAARALYDFLQRYPNSEWAPQARRAYDELHQQISMGLPPGAGYAT
jgi:membrane associated rhomboid family serine protease